MDRSDYDPDELDKAYRAWVAAGKPPIPIVDLDGIDFPEVDDDLDPFGINDTSGNCPECRCGCGFHKYGCSRDDGKGYCPKCGQEVNRYQHKTCPKCEHVFGEPEVRMSNVEHDDDWRLRQHEDRIAREEEQRAQVRRAEAGYLGGRT
jgi:hypothetical protein